MFKKILYPTDFSVEAARALAYVKNLKNAGSEEVVLLHVIDRRGLSDLSRFATKDVAGILGEMELKAKKEMDEIERELKELGFKVRIRIEKGDPCREMLRIEEEENVSVIIIGARGKASSLPKMLLGSVSYNLVRKANKPVLIVKK
ncbi:MAG: universal stress protein [Syntrophales bacterium]|jgi:nucleotide-binding universal stress UspA family protein|nr:universal stress protein [Syntrophales bacterium]MDY0044644.1 universal stress protein [Syntrophales bacterium]